MHQLVESYMTCLVQSLCKGSLNLILVHQFETYIIILSYKIIYLQT